MYASKPFLAIAHKTAHSTDLDVHTQASLLIIAHSTDLDVHVLHAWHLAHDLCLVGKRHGGVGPQHVA